MPQGQSFSEQLRATLAGEGGTATLPPPTPKGRFDTALSEADESKFQAWKTKYAPNDSGDDYDLRGAFKAGLTPDPQSGHWPDTFKKPNHETFSDESIYAKFGKPGHWDGDTFIPAQKPKPSYPLEPTAGEEVSDFFGGLVRGTAETGASIADSLAIFTKKANELVGTPIPYELRDYEMSKFAQGIRDAAKAASPTESGKNTTGEKLGEAIGSGVGFLAGGAAMAPLKLAPAMRIAMLGAASNASQGYFDALQHGATEEQASVAWLLSGGVGLSEAIPLGGILGRALGQGGIKGKLLRHMMTEGFENFAQEFGQQAAGNLIASSLVGYDKDRKFLQGALENGALGFFSGAALSALGTGVGKLSGPAAQAQAAAVPPTVAGEPTAESAAPGPAPVSGLPPTTGAMLHELPQEATQILEPGKVHPLIDKTAPEIASMLERRAETERTAAESIFAEREKDFPGFTSHYLDLVRKAREPGNPEAARSLQQVRAIDSKLSPGERLKLHPREEGSPYSTEELVDAHQALTDFEKQFPAAAVPALGEEGITKAGSKAILRRARARQMLEETAGRDIGTGPRVEETGAHRPKESFTLQGGAADFVSRPVAAETRAQPATSQAATEAAVVPWQIPDETKTQRLLSRYVNDAERVAVLEPLAPGKVTGETLADTYQKLPGMIAGKGEVLDKTVWKPTLQDMHKAGIDPEVSKPGLPSLADYADALGAEQRNATIEERSKGEVKDGSGLSTEAAQKIIAEAESGPAAPQYVAIKDRIATMNETGLDHLVESGLISPEERASYEKAFGKFYTPHETVYDPEVLRSGLATLSVSGREFARAEGRSTRAFNPFVQNIVSKQTSIIRGEKNRVANKAAEWIAKNPELGRTTDSLASVKDAERRAGRIISYKQNGQERYVAFNDQRLADWARRLESTQVDDTLRTLDTALNWLRKANTSWNPIFWATNFARDLGLATFKMGTEESVKFAADVLKNVPRAVRVMARIEVNDAAPGAMEDTYRLIRANGGIVGTIDLSTMTQRLSDMQSELDAGVTRKALTKFGRALIEINQAFESATRLAVAQTALDHGKTPAEAALAYRKVTADFARKGEKSALWSRVYLFFNANVQGTSGVVESFAKHPQRGATAAGILIGMGYTFSLLSRAMADDDDDGISMYDKITDYEKSRKLGVMFGDKFYGPPAPWGYGFFSALGYDLEHLKSGKITAGQAMSRTLANLLENSSPLPAGSLSQMAVPTVLRPVTELAANENFAGAPIKPELNKFESPELQPQHTRKFKTVNPLLDQIATGASEATGGDKLRSGKVEFSPEDAEHLLGWIGGGLGRFGGRVFSLASKGVRGDPVYLSDWPGLRSFVSTVPEFDTSKRYYDNIGKIEAASARLKNRTSLTEDDRFMLRFENMARQVDKVVHQLRKGGAKDEVVEQAQKKLNGTIEQLKARK